MVGFLMWKIIVMLFMFRFFRGLCLMVSLLVEVLIFLILLCDIFVFVVVDVVVVELFLVVNIGVVVKRVRVVRMGVYFFMMR